MAIVSITSLANNIVIIPNVFTLIIISVLIKKIVMVITPDSIIMVRSINSNIVVISSLGFQSNFNLIFSFTNSVTTVRWLTNIIAVVATNIVHNAVTILTITIVIITRLANIDGIVANIFVSFVLSVLI
jgi:hypothetical protein